MIGNGYFEQPMQGKKENEVFVDKFTKQELKLLQKDIDSIIRPLYCQASPQDLGNPGHGKLKADQWKMCICQGFIGRTPARVRDGSLPKGLNEYPTQLPCLRQLRTRVGSKSLVMQDCKRLPWLITTPEYFGNLRREMSQVATRTFNVLYYFPFI